MTVMCEVVDVDLDENNILKKKKERKKKEGVPHSVCCSEVVRW
jgi:hypothetical protein